MRATPDLCGVCAGGARWRGRLLWLALLVGGAGCGTVESPTPASEPTDRLLSTEAVGLDSAAQTQVANLLAEATGLPHAWHWPGSDLRPTPEELARGAELFGRHCTVCHGPWGAGDGPLATSFDVAPRDFRRGVFKFQSTFYGAKPLFGDLERTIAHGLPGTAMPASRRLGPAAVAALAQHVIWLSRRGEIERELLLAAETGETLDTPLRKDVEQTVQSAWDEAPLAEIPIATPHPEATPESVARGRLAFASRGCAKCHGPDGRGDTEENLRGGLRDYWGHPVRAADLTTGRLKGGRQPEAIYRRILGGINGTPMPSFRATLASEPDTIWDLVDFVLQLPQTSARSRQESP